MIAHKDFQGAIAEERAEEGAPDFNAPDGVSVEVFSRKEESRALNDPLVGNETVGTADEFNRGIAQSQEWINHATKEHYIRFSAGVVTPP